MNPLQSFVVDHPYICTAIAIIVVGRILTRDIGRANKYINEINAEKPASISAEWDGVIDRRGPNRAKNVIRPAFGETSNVQDVTETVARNDQKTGTHD